MRVLHLLESTRFSGAENVVCQIISLFNNDEQIEMAYCSRDGQIRTALKERDIQFIPIHSLSVQEIRRVIKEYNPDIIHAHDMKASFISALSTSRIRIISHIHNNSFDSRGVNHKSIAYLLSSVRFSQIFWVSDSSFNGYVFRNMLKRKSDVIYNIIDINALREKTALDSNNYDYDIVYLGRLTEPKDPIRLMNVFSSIIAQNSKVKIAVIGTGDLEKDTKEAAEKLKILDNVSFLGFLNNPYKILSDSKLMIMTSKWEGTPMCVLEAMSLGIPIVSTPTDGVSFVVENGHSGLLASTNEDLVDCCTMLLNDSEKRTQFSAAAKLRAIELMNCDLYRQRIKKAYTGNI